MMKTVTFANNLPYVSSSPEGCSGALREKLIDALLELSRSDAAVNDSHLAHMLGYSCSQVHRLCLSAVGETAHSFAMRLRLERSAGRLAVERLHVGEVVAEAGFSAREAFSRAFASHFGCSPAKFRALNQGSCMALPGYQMDVGGDWSRSARVKFGDSEELTFLYDRPVLLGRALPNGVIDWRSTFRRQLSSGTSMRSPFDAFRPVANDR